MGAPEGNQFWKLRSRHGAHKLFETPELMWEAACEYFQWCDENPIEVNDFRGKDAEEVILKKDRPYTLHGLCLYMDVSTGYFREFKKDCTKDFVSVVTRIEETIYDQKFTGASVGLFNHNIIARDLGLADKKEIDKTTTKVKFTDAG